MREPNSSLVRHRRSSIEEHADRLTDAQAIGPARPRLDQVNQLVALIEAVDHRRGVIRPGRDKIDLCREVSRAIVAGYLHLVTDRKFWQLRLRHEEAQLHV